MPLAILQMSDTPQIESTSVMLRYAGYDVKVCSAELRSALVSAGCDTVLAVSQMVSLGYDELEPSIQEAGVADMEVCDLLVEIKVRNVQKIKQRWPRLGNKIAWWRVNGAQPEICPQGGDEVNLPCPIITACLWYGLPRYYQDEHTKPKQDQSSLEHLASRPISYTQLLDIAGQAKTGMNGMAYTFWPPYPRSLEYDLIDRSGIQEFADTTAYCMCHNAYAWGYREIIDRCTNELGVRIYGNGSPAGQVSHKMVPRIAGSSKALVHLKSVDCPGWALYEAMLAGCPVITGRLLNSRMLAYALLEHGVTCLEFGVPASLEYGRGDIEIEKCYDDITSALALLSDPVENLRIGRSGRERLNGLMWKTEVDGDSFDEFMERWFVK